MRCRKSNAKHMTFKMGCPKLRLGRSSLQSRCDRIAHKGCAPKRLSTASCHAFKGRVVAKDLFPMQSVKVKYVHRSMHLCRYP